MLFYFVLLSLALPSFVTPAPSVQFSVSLSTQIPGNPSHNRIALLSEEVPIFDDERIQDYPDKKLLGRLREFFKTFTTGDFKGMRDLQTPNYTMTNIRERHPHSPQHLLSSA